MVSAPIESPLAAVAPPSPEPLAALPPTVQALLRLAARTPVRGIASDARPEPWPALRAAYAPPLELPGAVAIDTTRSLPDAVGAALAAVAGGQPVDPGAMRESGDSPTSNRPAARTVVTQEQPMSPTVLAPRRVRELTLALKAEAARLRRTLDALDRAGRELAVSQADEGDFNAELGDIATDLAEEQLDLSLTTLERARRAAVEAALLRLAEGRYGRCERCGDPIDAERLGALPWTSYCVRCAAAPGPHPPATVPARFAGRFD
jgi:DnaK suppressor protein